MRVRKSRGALKMRSGIDHIGVSVVYFCHDGKGNFIMAKRNNNARDEKGRWDCGGGAVEFGDDVLLTLKREIKEEYCTDILQFEFLGYRDVHRMENKVKSHWITLDFKVLVDSSKVRLGEPDKFHEIKWYAKNTIPKDSHSQFPTFLKLYGTKLFC